MRIYTLEITLDAHAGTDGIAFLHGACKHAHQFITLFWPLSQTTGYPYTDDSGREIAYKVRVVPDKLFRSQGNIKDALLFGQSMWNKGGKYVTIVEGELDALAAYQMMGSKYPVVSIKNGAQSAVKDCQAQYEWLEKGVMQLWIAYDSKESKVKCVCVTEIRQYPNYKVCDCKITTGTDYKSWVDFMDDVVNWARSQGCKKMEIFTRPGWERILKYKGFVKTHVQLEKPL